MIRALRNAAQQPSPLLPAALGGRGAVARADAPASGHGSTASTTARVTRAHRVCALERVTGEIGAALTKLTSANKYWGSVAQPMTDLLTALTAKEAGAAIEKWQVASGKTVRAALHEAPISKAQLRAALDAVDDARLRTLGSRRALNLHRVCEDRKGAAHSLTDVRLRFDRTENNQIVPVVGRKTAQDGIIPAIAHAKTSVHILMLEYQDGVFGGPMTDLLIAKARSGVKVRMVISADESLQTPGSGHHTNVERLLAAGVEVVRQEGRTKDYLHDKLICVDSEIALIGGWTMCDRSFCSDSFSASYDRVGGERCEHGFPVVPDDDQPQTYDFQLRLEGPAAQDAQLAFMATWSYHGRSIEPALSDTAFKRKYFPEKSSASCRSGGENAKIFKSFSFERNHCYDAMIGVMRGATKTLDCEFAYVMSNDVVNLLTQKARDGVKVRMLVPRDQMQNGFIDGAAYRLLLAGYGRMLDAGVAIHEYNGYCHGKIVCGDAQKVWVGSGNPDVWFSGNPKGGRACDIAVVTESRAVADACNRQIFAGDFDPSRSSRVTHETLAAKGRLDWVQAWGIRKVYDAIEHWTGASELPFDEPHNHL